MRLLFTLFVCVGLTACSSLSLPLPAGAVCNADADCASGLMCLDFATVASDGGCTVVGKGCSKSCTTDADCTSLGAKFMCFAACGGTRTCGATL